MKSLLNKEIKLASSPLSWIFIVFALMTLIPRYPILVGAFFICLGLFYSFQSGRENNDILYTVLLPMKKTDAVRAKYTFAVLVQMIGFAVCAVLTVLRMTVMANAAPYQDNPMMNANQAYLSYILLVFALFNTVFLGGFFRTAYKYGKPFILFIIASFVVVTAAEVLHHLPGLAFLNGTAALGDVRMWLLLAGALTVYIVATVISCRVAMRRFDKVDM